MNWTSEGDEYVALSPFGQIRVWRGKQARWRATVGITPPTAYQTAAETMAAVEAYLNKEAADKRRRDKRFCR